MGECLMYGLDLESRCLSSVVDEDSVKFLIGTNNIKLDNQISYISVEGDYARISSQAFAHPAGEVRAIASSPKDPNLLASSAADYRNVSPKFQSFIYRMNFEKRVLEEVTHIDSEKCPKSFEWEPQNNHGCIMYDNNIDIYDLNEGFTKVNDYKMDGTTHAQVWSPHNGGITLGLAIDRDIICLDSRTTTSALKIADAHSHRALNLDFNPNLQHVIASCGDEGAVLVWDWRHPATPLMSLKPHAHWVWQVKFHPVHDQLLLTSGSDACVVLSCMQSVSSESHLDQEDETERLEDGILERIEEHEESVYACAWSIGDPWAFASLSHDGRVVISRVKRKHKYVLMQL